MEVRDILESYQQLCQKVERKFCEISERHAGAMTCKRGCYACCASGLSVGTLEAAVIAEHVGARPELQRKLNDLAKAPPYQDRSCSMLDANGLCSIYKVRPVICRSHGIPVVWQDDRGQNARAVCALNFDNVDLEALAISDTLNLETLNSTLAALTEIFAKSMDVVGQTRYPLAPETFLD